MNRVELTLPDSVKEFLDTEVAAKGCSSPSEYFVALLQEIQKRRAVWAK